MLTNQSTLPVGIGASDLVEEALSDAPSCVSSIRFGSSRAAEAEEDPVSKLALGPLSFWFLNHKLEKKELAFQIRELKEKGFSGFFLHPRSGLLTPYGSTAWYDAVHFCIHEAKKLGMEAWLYDEDPYPSGAAGGKVTLDHPELRASYLEATVANIPGGQEVEVDLPPGALIGVYLVANGKVRRIDECAGIIRTRWSQFLSTGSYYPPYSAEGNPHWRAKAVAPHYRVFIKDCDGPASVVAFVRQYAIADPWGDYPDLLNPKAVDLFIEYTHEAYWKRWSGEIGLTVPGIFTDEPKLRGQLPWSESVLPAFDQMTGEHLVDVLPHLVIEIDARTPFLRWAYREALARTFLSSFAEKIRQACDDRKMIWTGHISPEEDPVGQVIYVPGLMRAISKMDIPGTDLIGADIGDAQHPLLHLSPKLASSAAHAAGKRFVICEAFAVVDWVQDFAFMAKCTNWLYALGVNRLTTHGQFYSIDGLRKREAAPSQFIQASYWEHFGALSRYVEGLSRYLSEGTHEASLLVYYPEESFMTLACNEDDPRHQIALEARDKLGALVHDLLTAGYDFDLADAEIISRASFAKKRVTIASEQYRAVVVPGIYLRKDSWDILMEIKEAGVPVLFVEPSVLILSPVYCERIAVAEPWRSASESLSPHLSPLFRSSGALIAHKRNTPGGDVIFLVNNGKVVFDGEIELNFFGPYERWVDTSDTWQEMESPVRTHLASGEGVLLRQRRSSAEIPKALYGNAWEAIANIGKDWVARPLADNCLILNEFRSLALPPGDIGDEALEEHRFTSAPLVDLLSPDSSGRFKMAEVTRVFCTSFEWEGPLVPLYLVCDSQLGPSGDGGYCKNIEIFCNRKPLSPLSLRKRYDPYNCEARIDSLVKEGRNFIFMVQRLSCSDDLALPYDALRLFGDFHAEFPYGRSVPAKLSARPGEYECGTPIHPAQIGHAHYGGLISYQTSFDLHSRPPRAGIRFEHVYESAELLVNGIHAGILWKPPYFLEISPSLLQVGKNELSLICSTSPANYLQGCHRPAGTYGKIEFCVAA